MRLGIFGGTFDPPHLGHLLVASDAHDALALDRVLFVPAAAQPFKVASVVASPEQRFRMLELTVENDPRFAVDRAELDRAGLSYTVDTLELLAARYAGAQLHLLIGEDLARQIASWRAPQRIAELARIVVLTRANGAAHDEEAGTPPMQRLRTRRIDISSTEIRERVRAGQSIHGFVTDGVASLIRAAGLYR